MLTRTMFSFLMLLAGSGQATAESLAKPISVGQDFPSLRLLNFKSKKKESVKDFAKGKKVTIVDFWASWCKPCLSSMPTLNEIFEKYQSEGVMVVGINLDEDIKVGREFANKLKIAFPILHDKERKLTEAVGVNVMPSTYFIDGEGKVTVTHRGFREGDKEKLLSHLNEKLSR